MRPFTKALRALLMRALLSEPMHLEGAKHTPNGMTALASLSKIIHSLYDTAMLYKDFTCQIEMYTQTRIP